jgi:hypothetical protein
MIFVQLPEPLCEKNNSLCRIVDFRLLFQTKINIAEQSQCLQGEICWYQDDFSGLISWLKQFFRGLLAYKSLKCCVF